MFEAAHVVLQKQKDDLAAKAAHLADFSSGRLFPKTSSQEVLFLDFSTCVCIRLRVVRRAGIRRHSRR